MGRGGGGWEGSSRLERLGREIQVLEPPFGNVEREKKQKRVHFGEISVAAGLPQVWSCHAQYLWGSSTCKAPTASERRCVIQQMCQIPSTNSREWRALYAGQLGISVLSLTCCMTLDKELNLSFSIKLGSAHLTELLQGLNVTMYAMQRASTRPGTVSCKWWLGSFLPPGPLALTSSQEDPSALPEGLPGHRGLDRRTLRNRRAFRMFNFCQFPIFLYLPQSLQG